MKKTLILVIFFYILAVLQTSFFIQFSIFGIAPNLILISACLLSFSAHKGSLMGGKKTDQNIGIYSAIIGGFFLDVFSSHFFGASIIILLVINIFIKTLLGFLKEISNRCQIIYFIIIFVFSLIIYDSILSLVLYFFNSVSTQFNLLTSLTKIAYNLVFASIFFYLLKGYNALKKV